MIFESVEKLTTAQSVALNSQAMAAFKLLRRVGEDQSVTATSVAYAVGHYARRNGITGEQLSRWLQSAYGLIWVRQGGLNPGLDLKDVMKAIMKAFNMRNR